jgi:hypothetical protein
MEVIKTYSLFLNTREANYGNSNNCTFVFTTPIVLTNSNNRFTICVKQAEIPYSFSQINANNYDLEYSYTDNQGSGNNYNSKVQFPPGNYNITNLLNELILLLITDIYIKIPSSVISSNNFIFSYNNNTNLITFLISGLPYTVSITLKFSTNYTLGVMFGFPQTNQTFGTAIKLTSSNKLNVNPISSIYIRSENIKFLTNFEAIVEQYANSDVLCKVQVQTLPGTLLYVRSDTHLLINNTYIPQLNLYLSDNQTPTYTLQMNGLNYGIQLEINEVMVKPTNSGLDLTQTNEMKPPKEMEDTRDELLKDLLKTKVKLEKELEDKKAKKLLENSGEKISK